MGHCEGDEHVNETTCRATSEEAWKPDQGECDVGSIDGDDVRKHRVCTELGASWEPLPCMIIQMFMGFMEMSCGTDEAPDETSKMMFGMMVKDCCKYSDGTDAPVRPLCSGSGGGSGGGAGGHCVDVPHHKLDELRHKGYTPRYCT